MRRLEARIGKLIGPAPTPSESGARNGSTANDPFEDGLTKNERTQFRQMAEHEFEVFSSEHLAQQHQDQQAGVTEVTPQPQHEPPRSTR